MNPEKFENFEPHYNYEVPLDQMNQHLISLHLFYSIPPVDLDEEY